MSLAKGEKNRKVTVLNHRRIKYLDGIQDLIDGQGTPQYVNIRWRKLKAIRRAG